MTTIGKLLTRNSVPLVMGLAFLAALSLPFAAITRSQDDGSRQIVLEEFTRARPPATSAKAQAPVKTGTRKPTSASVTKAPRYVRKTPLVIATMKTNSEVMEIGVTIWRLRPATGNDGGARVLVMEERTANRVDSATH